MQAVLFDLDGTLLDRDKSLLAFLNWQVSSMLPVVLSNKAAFIQRFVQLDDNGRVWKDQVYAVLIEEFELSGYTVAELVDSYSQCFRHFCRPYPGVEKALKEIRAMAMKMAVVTNGFEQLQRSNFTALGFSRLIPELVSSEAVNSRKPEAEIFLHTCRVLGVAASDCIFVGDSQAADIVGANAVGMVSVYCGAGSCSQADAVITQFSQLTALIESLNLDQ